MSANGVRVSCEETPLVRITPEAKRRLDAYMRAVPTEVSGLCRVKQEGAGVFLITEVLLYEQEVTAGSTDIDQGAVATFLTDQVSAGKDVANLRGWWHKHPSSLFWSPTDTDTITTLGSEWMISIVGNTRGEYLVRLDLYKPVRLTLDGLQLHLSTAPLEKEEKEVAAEVKKKVREKVYTYPTYGGGYGRPVGGYRGGKWGGYDDF